MVQQMEDIRTAWITTNYSCNINCEWCYAKNTANCTQKMDINTAKSIVDSLVDLGVRGITLIGGEPTLHNNIVDIITYIKDKDPTIKIGLTTNGICLENNAFAKQLVKAGLSGCNVSIKGLSAEAYFESTGSADGYEKMLKGYHNIKEAGCNTVASFVITEYDKRKIDNLNELCHEKSIEKILIQFVKPTVGLISEPIMPMKDMAKTVKYIYENWNDIDYKIEISFPICLIDKIVFDDLYQHKKLKLGCHIQTGNGINFDTEGRIIPCNHFVDLPYDKDPHLSSNSIKEVWNSVEFQKIMNKSCCFPSLKCKTCERWDICRGGCFTRWFYEDPGIII